MVRFMCGIKLRKRKKELMSKLELSEDIGGALKIEVQMEFKMFHKLRLLEAPDGTIDADERAFGPLGLQGPKPWEEQDG